VDGELVRVSPSTRIRYNVRAIFTAEANKNGPRIRKYRSWRTLRCDSGEFEHTTDE